MRAIVPEARYTVCVGKRALLVIESDAPDKPALGAPCNGCGVCCLAEPCPVGVILSRRTTGACVALVWNAQEKQYRCGAMMRAGIARGMIARWISAGSGCDCDVEVER